MKEQISKLLKKVLDKKGIKLSEKEIEQVIEIPPSSELGDYAFPCFFLKEKLKQNPVKIAEEIKTKIPSSEIISSVNSNGSYINFFLNKEKISKELIKEIMTKKDRFGSSDIGKGKKALVEHTSINPNASPHVGRARNAIIGDSIVQILKFLNFKTEVHYYVNDVSKQIAMLVLANADKLNFSQMLKKYIEISEKVSRSQELEKKVFDLLSKFEKGDKKITEKFRRITKTCVNGQAKIFSEVGIKYDYFDYESDYIQPSKKILSEFKKSKKLFTDDYGRLVLNQAGTSVENKMKSPVLVLTRSDGTGLYPLRDIAYTIYKLKRAKKNMIILGEDQKLYFQQLSEALKLLNYSSPEVIHYSFILLKENGKSKKMSTRKGDIVLFEDLLKEAVSKAQKEIEKRKTKGNPKIVAISSIKYSILKNHPNKSILFDMEEALNFEGDTGPYILYSYARASSILKKANRKLKKDFDINKLDKQEFELVKKFLQFNDIVLNSYNSMNPSAIANYSYQLSQLFNEFYHSCPVINSDNENFRLLLVDSFRQVLKNSLSLLGIKTIDEM